MTTGLLYVLFFLSGAAALVYQVAWVHGLTLVFGGSHLAVTAVLTIFMSGLAAGGYLAGRRVDRVAKPLRLYGMLELAIAVCALGVAALLEAYPSIYAALAQGRDDSTAYLTAIRLLFSVVALIVPTMLMGATLPVVSRFVARHPDQLRRHLSFLYSVNTLGAVAGAVVAGFVLLRFYSFSITVYAAVATNVAIGLASLMWQRKLDRSPTLQQEATDAPAPRPTPSMDGVEPRVFRWVAIGIGVSGFCALGYEVLWTRVLTVAVGASVYGFTIILAAFLTGIALGSQAHGLLSRLFRRSTPGTRRIVAWFGLTQILVGVTALAVTLALRDIPFNVMRLQGLAAGSGLAAFEARTWAGFALAFLYMAVPAAFMGAAFPLAGEALVRYRNATGRAVGDVLAANTIGAILGAATSGLVLIVVFGIERSLQLLTALNIGLGLVVLAGLRRTRWLTAAAAVSTLGVMAVLAVNQDAARMWNRDYLAIFRSNQPDAFRTPELIREAIDNTNVLYYAEGAESIVSVIQVKGGLPAFVTNGRVEASAHPQAQQVQFTLGHLPMLLARDPRQVLVIGVGSGMTAGAAAAHPGVEQVTLVEIEPRVTGVARTFADYNHHVLDDPKVRVVFNDGRNFLTTTRRMFDVITADPIHPWFRGAGSLYATEYFAMAADHLRPGGVIAQWLPIYELTPADLASVVKTFQQHFAHTMLWLIHGDAVIVGSDTPFAVDETEIERRLSAPAVAGDLSRVHMGSATSLLSFFVMGTEGMRRFAQDGTLNTDDRPYLEFSAPFSIADTSLMATNVDAISAQRESILPYLQAPADPAARLAQQERWSQHLAAGALGDRALALCLGQGPLDWEFVTALRRLSLEYPAYAPGQALWTEHQAALALQPRLLERKSFHFIAENGPTFVEVSAVLVPVSETRASVMFVDNAARTVFGQAYLDNYDRDERAVRFAADVMAAISTAYDALAASAQQAGLPQADAVRKSIAAVVGSKVNSVQSGS